MGLIWRPLSLWLWSGWLSDSFPAFWPGDERFCLENQQARCAQKCQQGRGSSSYRFCISSSSPVRLLEQSKGRQKDLCMVHEIKGSGKKAVSEDETRLRMVLRVMMDSLGRNGKKRKCKQRSRKHSPRWKRLWNKSNRREWLANPRAGPGVREGFGQGSCQVSHLLKARDWVGWGAFRPASMQAKSLKLSQALCDPMDSGPPGSSVHGILQAPTPGVGFHALFQGIFLTQGLNPRLLHLLSRQVDSSPLAPPGWVLIRISAHWHRKDVKIHGQTPSS